MSSSPRPYLTRRIALASAMALLVGCGFAPVHAPDGAGDMLRGKVSVTAPDTVTGYALRQRLVDRFGRASNPSPFHVTVDLTTQRNAATITTDGDTTRFDISGTATWTFEDAAQTMTENGQAQTFTSYSTTGSTVATQAAQADAEHRLSVALADIIVTQLITRASAR